MKLTSKRLSHPAIGFSFPWRTLPASWLSTRPFQSLRPRRRCEVRVRLASDGSEWQNVFAWETVCKAVKKIRTPTSIRLRVGRTPM